MKTGRQIVDPRASLRAKVKAYRKRAAEAQRYLSAHPTEWGRFQSEFNQEVNGIFRDVMIFEMENLASGDEDRVYKLKRFFVERFRDEFLAGEYASWSLKKPVGYAGDYWIIDEIYKNAPASFGYKRLHDNYFQMSAISNAVRNRKEDFKRFMVATAQSKKNSRPRILNVASGPCREVYELLKKGEFKDSNVVFHCVEQDPKAIEYAQGLLGGEPRVKFFQQNAVRLALSKDIHGSLEGEYDFIYSTGLFDYLDRRVSLRLAKNLKELLSPGGVLAVSDVRDKFSNPSVYYMEWVGDWNLVYRDDDDFRRIFLEAGFAPHSLACKYEQQGVMQYVLAKRED